MKIFFLCVAAFFLVAGAIAALVSPHATMHEHQLGLLFIGAGIIGSLAFWLALQENLAQFYRKIALVIFLICFCTAVFAGFKIWTTIR